MLRPHLIEDAWVAPPEKVPTHLKVVSGLLVKKHCVVAAHWPGLKNCQTRQDLLLTRRLHDVCWNFGHYRFYNIQTTFHHCYYEIVYVIDYF